MNKKQLEVCKSLENIDKMITDLNKDNTTSQKQIDDIEVQMQKLNDEKMGKGPVIPGKKLQEFIEHWDKMLIGNQYPPIEILEYSKELPLTLKQFEQDLL